MNTLHQSSKLNSAKVFFCAWMRARIEAEDLKHNVRVAVATTHNPLPQGDPSEGSIRLALLVDVYHHLEFPRTVCRRLRALLHPEDGRLVIIDFHRDPTKVKSKSQEWVMKHLRAGQGTFREEIISAGFVLESEPNIPELTENYCMIFRPMSASELGKEPGFGWASTTKRGLPVVPTEL